MENLSKQKTDLPFIQEHVLQSQHINLGWVLSCDLCFAGLSVSTSIHACAVVQTI